MPLSQKPCSVQHRAGSRDLAAPLLSPAPSTPSRSAATPVRGQPVNLRSKSTRSPVPRAPISAARGRRITRLLPANEHPRKETWQTVAALLLVAVPIDGLAPELSGRATPVVNDAAGERTSRTDFAGRVTQYAYDLAGRLTRRTYPDGSVHAFGYTATGRRQSMTDARGTTSYGYDARDRVTSLILPASRGALRLRPRQPHAPRGARRRPDAGDELHLRPALAPGDGDRPEREGPCPRLRRQRQPLAAHPAEWRHDELPLRPPEPSDEPRGDPRGLGHDRLDAYTLRRRGTGRGSSRRTGRRGATATTRWSD